MTLVVDASVTLAWGFADEATPATDAILDRVAAEGMHLPPIWRVEVANVLVTAERRKRINPEDTEAFLDRLRALPATVSSDEMAAWHAVVVLARAHQLSTYDASYVELALRLGLSLATLDERVRTAAARVGVPVLP